MEEVLAYGSMPYVYQNRENGRFYLKKLLTELVPNTEKEKTFGLFFENLHPRRPSTYGRPSV